MRRRLGFVAVLALLPLAVLALDPDAGEIDDPRQKALYDRLTNETRCLVCQNQTIADSTAPLAADLRREIREMVVAGQGEEEIKRFLVERYGDFVLYSPPWQPTTALLWLAPGLLLALGAWALWRVVRRRAGLPVPDDDAEPARE